VPSIPVIEVAPVNQLEFDPLSPGGVGCILMICWCGIGEEDNNEKMWEALRTIQLVSCQNGISSSQYDRYPLDRNFGIPGPFGHGNPLPTCKYLAMQPQLCGCGLGAL